MWFKQMDSVLLHKNDILMLYVYIEVICICFIFSIVCSYTQTIHIYLFIYICIYLYTIVNSNKYFPFLVNFRIIYDGRDKNFARATCDPIVTVFLPLA